MSNAFRIKRLKAKSFENAGVNGALYYVIDDRSFNFIYTNHSFPSGRSYVLAFGLEIAVSLENGQLLGVTSYTFCGRWTISTLLGPRAFVKSPLYIDKYREMQCGAAHEIIGCSSESTQYLFDPTTGWFLAGADLSSSADELTVCFASGCYAVLSGDTIQRVWLQPANWTCIAEFLQAEIRGTGTAELTGNIKDAGPL